jgi:hypothetical protein
MHLATFQDKREVWVDYEVKWLVALREKMKKAYTVLVGKPGWKAH